MIGLYRTVTFAACSVLLASLGIAQNRAAYRDFEFGMSTDAVVKQTKSEPARVRTAHNAPDLIQTLQWDRQGYFSSSPATDSVRNIRFEFYNNQLFRIVAIYDNRQIEGMTAADLIEAISKIYGPSVETSESVETAPRDNYGDRQEVLAGWENAESSYSLYRSSSGEFGFVADSRKLSPMAVRSIREAERLEALAAPQREVERVRKEAEDRRIAQEKARAVNKPNFRP
jgi:hypothetical protein